MAIVLLFYKHSSLQNSEWMNEISKNGIDAALSKFCRQIPVSKRFEMYGSISRTGSGNVIAFEFAGNASQIFTYRVWDTWT